jgi:hypothetical protein
VRLESSTVAKVAATESTTAADQLRALRTVYDPEIDRLLAKHPNSPADLLEDLSHSADKATRRQVVRNACTPKGVLLRLAPQFPRDFLCNPVIDWMLIEEPDLLQNLGKGVLRSVLKSPTCPEALMGWAARNGTVEHQLALTMNPAATLEILETLAALKGEVGVAARAHVRYPKPSRLAKDASGQFIKAVKSSLASLEPNDAASLWRRGLIGPAQWLYLSAGSRAAVIGLPDSLEGGSWPSSSRCIALAKSKLCPPELFEFLAKHPDRVTDAYWWKEQRSAERVRMAVACNPNAPRSLLEALAAHQEVEVRQAVARNPMVPDRLLEALATDRHWSVRVAVAQNPRVPGSVLEALATDPDTEVRKAVVRTHRRKAPNPAVPTLEVPGSAQPSSLGISRRAPRWICIASDPATKPDVLAELSGRRNLVLRWLVAANPSTPEPIAKELTVILWLALGYEALPPRPRDLAEVCRPQVRIIMNARHWWHKLHLQARRYGYAKLPRSLTDSELVERFQRELKCFARNPQASLAAEVIGAYGQSLFRLNDRADTWGRRPVSLALKLQFREREEPFGRQPAGLPRLFALLHANAPVEALVKAYRSVDWMERMAVARNPIAPANTLAALKKDANRFVARQAADTEALQQELQQWPALAIKLHDRWQWALTGLASGTAVWDGYEGETSELLRRLRAHRKALEPLLSTAQDSNEPDHSMAPNADPSIAFKRVIEEILIRTRVHHMSEWMWNDPEWAQRVCAEDILAWLKHRVPDPSVVIAALQAQVSGLDQDKVFTEMAAEVVRPASSVPVRAPLPFVNSVATPALLESDPNLYRTSPSPEAQWHIGQSVSHSKFGMGTIIELEGTGSEARAHVHFQVSGHKWLLLSLARLESVPASGILLSELLARLGSSGTTDVRQAVAAHLETPMHTLCALAADPHADVRRRVASRPDATEEVLQLLAHDTDESVLVQIASRADLPGSIVENLMHSSDLRVLRAVAARGELPPTVYEHLARVNDPEVRLALARNPNTSSDLARKLLVVLSADASADVRVSVAGHPRTGEDLLRALENDDEEVVRSAVYARRFTEEWYFPFDGKPSFKKLVAVVKRLFVTNESADGVEADPTPISIAEHVLVGLHGLNLIPKSPSGRCLAQAARSKDWLTRLAVAIHPKATSPQLKLLERDEIPAVAHAVRFRTTGTLAD